MHGGEVATLNSRSGIICLT